MTKTFEVYGAGIGYLGIVQANTERGAKMIARRIWADVSSFAVKGL